MSFLVRNYLTLFLLSLIWGSSFILMKRGLDEYSAMQVACLRLFIAFISLTPFLFNAIKILKKKEIIPLIVSGFIGNGLPAFLFAKAQITLESSFTGALNSLTPIFTLLVGIYLFKNKTSKKNILGIILGFLGTAVLYVSKVHSILNVEWDILLIIIATFLYAISINVIYKYLRHMSPIYISSLSFLFIGPFSGYYILSTDFINIVKTEAGIISFGYVCVLAILCTSVAIIIFNQLLKDTSAYFASSVTYLIPIVALIWGVIDGELIQVSYFVGVFIVFLGIYLVNSKD